MEKIEDQKKLGELLKKHRGPVTTYQIIKDHGVTHQKIKAVEDGEKEYTFRTLLNYLDALGLELFIKPK